MHALKDCLLLGFLLRAIEILLQASEIKAYHDREEVETQERESLYVDIHEDIVLKILYPQRLPAILSSECRENVVFNSNQFEEFKENFSRKYLTPPTLHLLLGYKHRQRHSIIIKYNAQPKTLTSVLM